jgi:hypothetical protein
MGAIVSHALPSPRRIWRGSRRGGAFLVLMLAISACSRSPAPTPTPAAAARKALAAAERAAALERRVAAQPPVAGLWQRGAERSRYRAWFEHGQPVYLVEERSLGEYGSGNHHYYFADGRLFYYRAQESRTITSGAAAGGSVDSRLEAEFDGARATHATRVAHEGEIRLDAAAVADIVSHATALAEAAADEYSAQKLTAAAGATADVHK